jgi:hypothetical protein
MLTATLGAAVAIPPVVLALQPELTAYAGLSGLDRLRTWIKGRMVTPPIHHLIGLHPVEAGVGTCTFSTPASPWLAGHPGLYTGGVGALVADAALGGAVLGRGPGGVSRPRSCR